MTVESFPAQAYTSASQQPLGIYDLPFELLSDIALYLDFIDVVSFGQATKQFREASQARVVWHALAKEYSARHFYNVRPENGTIDTLTTDELRNWISPRLILDKMWKKDTIPPPRARFLNVSIETECWELLPGGRWLITGLGEGIVNFYDLNMEEPVPRPLLRPSPSVEGIQWIATSINYKAPVLEFTVALSYSGTSSIARRDRGNPHGLLGGIHISKAKPIPTLPDVARFLPSVSHSQLQLQP
ncbi:hypothetical protein P691DRAFT_759451 [Macrolepiota fuliginosa MF-IS2]|uniref:F-box domain-containing protein n=1 Tax=Macrolepiota fuliginosa MF-IS2 TaxID=1400762 RepID=A0A9P6C1Z1_9AGAR|nr:hypothetical protein P691DRAFT_759451 [Macrolepiota fuliginosa MF-IS2]